MIYDVAVIGGGAAGLLAAGIAADRSKSVILLEKNQKLGKKLYITGKGRCNLTNDSTVEEAVDNIIVNGKFLRNSLYQFPPQEVIDFFAQLGLKTVTERGKRVFPASGKASDVIKTLHIFLKSNQVLLKKEKVTKLTKRADHFLIECPGGQFKAEKVILATGGRSYPATGSTGDGYKFAASMGQNIVPPKPSLVPILTEPEWQAKIGRLHLKNIKITIYRRNKKLYTDFGELELSDDRVSGPLILTVSALFKQVKDLKLVIDLKPALTEQQLDGRLIRELEKDAQESFQKMLPRIVPIKLREVLLECTGINRNSPCGSLNKQQRRKLLDTLKGLSLTLTGPAGFEEAIITSGGVDVQEIDPMTMGSKIVDGLYFAGEVIDVDALTGGFNLQIAWSTAYSAGMSC